MIHQSRNSGWYYYGLSARKEFMDKNASLTLNGNNPFKGFRHRFSL